MKSDQPIDLFLPVRWVTALALVLVVAATLLQIVLRYAFNSPLIWSGELVKFLIVWIAFIGSAAVCFDGRHLNVDVFFKMMPEKGRNILRWINAAVSIGFLAVLAWTSITLVKIEMMQELSSIPLTLGHLRLAATVGAVLMIAGIIMRMVYFRPRRRRADAAYGNEDVM